MNTSYLYILKNVILEGNQVKILNILLGSICYSQFQCQ